MIKRRLSEKLAFAAADIFGGGSFNIVNFLYPGFLALAVGINPFWSSFIILISRIWDAVTDPVMGYISDHTQSRFGKRRIYLIVASPFVVISMFLLFFPFHFSNQTLTIIAVLTSYLIFVTVQTSVMIPYYSLSSEIAKDYQERASFNSFRLGFSIFASIVCVAAPGIIVNLFKDSAIPNLGYMVMSGIFGLIFGACVLITGLFSREEIQTPPLATPFSLKEISKSLKLQPFRQYLGMFLVLQMAMAIMSGVFFFYADFYLDQQVTASGDASLLGTLAAALMFFMQIVALPVYLKIIEKKGKTTAYRWGSYLWIGGAIILFFIPANVASSPWPWSIFVLAALMGFGISGPGLVPHTMYGDVVDAGELKFNERLDGQMSGFTNFINKVAQALGLSLIMLILGWAGFQEQQVGMPKITSQPDSALLAIRLILLLAPIVFMSIGIFISFRYRIDANRHKEIRAELDQRKGN